MFPHMYEQVQKIFVVYGHKDLKKDRGKMSVYRVAPHFTIQRWRISNCQVDKTPRGSHVQSKNFIFLFFILINNSYYFFIIRPFFVFVFIREGAL